MESQTEHRLVVIEGPAEGRSYRLDRMITTLGRASDNTIVLDSSRISRHHAQIRLLPRGAIVEDLESTNGTWVNDHRLTQAHGLTPGDQVRLADYITFRYVERTVPAETESARWTPTRVEDEGAEPDDVRPVAPSAPDHGTTYEAQEDVIAPAPDIAEELYERPTSEFEDVEPEAPSQRSRAFYLILGLLVILVCLCIATAVYLWFAPVEFWERVFDLFGIPLPSVLLYLS